MNGDDPQPWEQLAEKSDKAFGCFVAYRNAGRPRALRDAVGRGRGRRLPVTH